jgi:hypothetical protein
VQIEMRGNEKQSYTVMVAVTVDGLKLRLFTMVRGKTVRSGWVLHLDPGRLDGPAHTATGQQTTETMQQWLMFLRSLPEYADMHEVHVIIDCYAAHVCDDVRALAGELGIRLHYIAPGLTDILQALDRAVFGALKVGVWSDLQLREVAEG